MSFSVFVDDIKIHIFSFLVNDADLRAVRLAFRKARFLLGEIRKIITEGYGLRISHHFVTFLASSSQLTYIDLQKMCLSSTVTREDFCKLSRLNLQFIEFPKDIGLVSLFIHNYRLLRNITGKSTPFDFKYRRLAYIGQKLKSNSDILNAGFTGNELAYNSADVLYLLEVLIIRRVTIHLHFGRHVYSALNVHQIPLHLVLETDDFDDLPRNWSTVRHTLVGANIQKLSGRILKDGVDMSNGVFSKVLICDTVVESIDKLIEVVREIPLARSFKVKLSPGNDVVYRDRVVQLLRENPHIDFIILVNFNSCSNIDDLEDDFGIFLEVPDYIRRRIEVVNVNSSIGEASVKRILQMEEKDKWDDLLLNKRLKTSREH